jgi:hypothetical protein
MAPPLCSTEVVQKAHIVSQPEVAEDAIVLIVIAEDLSSVVVVVVVLEVDLAVVVGQDAISMPFELRLNVQEAIFEKKKKVVINSCTSKKESD